MTTRAITAGERVLLVAPTGADAMNLCSILQRAGLTSAACPHLGALAVELEKGCGAILLTE
jgi:hypothetical protein